MGTRTSQSWTCRGCSEQNDLLDRVCSKCGGDGRAAIAGAFIDERSKAAGIPVTQAEAAAKEAAVDEKDRTIQVALSKSTAFEAEIFIRGSGEQWAVGWNFQSKTSGRINPIATASREFACEEAAAASGFEALRLWLQGQPESPKRRKALAETGIHEARAIGPWLKQHNKEFTQPRPSLPKTAAAAPPAVPLAERVNGASVEQLELARIQPSPENRKDFDPTELQELADSIKSHGLGQPVMVCRLHADPAIGGKTWELIAGERRYRASQLAGLVSIPARVIDCSPAEARELRLIENLKRKDLSAIEEARGYQTLLQENGYTQKVLGEKLGVDQSTIANRLRLLRLPEVWQQKIISREITESHGRILVDLADQPKVLELLVKPLAEELRKEKALPSLKEWPQWIYETIKRKGRPCEPGTYFSIPMKSGAYLNGHVLFTAKDLQNHAGELELITVTRPATNWQKAAPVRFALNEERWRELHFEKVKAAEERDAKRNARGAKETKGAEPTAAQVAARKEDQAKQLAKKIASYRNRWLQQRCSIACQTLTHEQGVKLLLGFAGMTDRDRCRRDDLMAAIKEAGEKTITAQHDARPMLSVLSLPDEKLLKVAKAAIGRWVAQSVEGYGVDLHAVDLPAIAQLLDVDLARDWRVDEEFLLLHTKDQLRELFKEWKLIGPLQEKRTDIIKEVLDSNTNNRLPAPKALVRGLTSKG